MPKRTAGMYASYVLTLHPVVRRLKTFPHRWLAAPKLPRYGHCSRVVLMMSVCRGRPLVCSHAHHLSRIEVRVQRLSMYLELLAVAKLQTIGRTKPRQNRYWWRIHKTPIFSLRSAPSPQRFRAVLDHSPPVCRGVLSPWTL
jgi:hypothetical protein